VREREKSESGKTEEKSKECREEQEEKKEVKGEAFNKNSLTIAWRYACTPARIRTPPAATTRLAMTRAACSSFFFKVERDEKVSGPERSAVAVAAVFRSVSFLHRKSSLSKPFIVSSRAVVHAFFIVAPRHPAQEAIDKYARVDRRPRSGKSQFFGCYCRRRCRRFFLSF
jgi:hypothetical protein